MIGLDTNVLVRYIVQDDLAQAGKATALIESLTDENPGFISMTALVELVWVIQGCYAAAKDETVAILDKLLRLRTLRLENMEVVSKAVRVYAASSADFADCLIESSGSHAQCSHTATFDGNASKTAGMQLIR
jgi:predicted nucleic-acid-binding protein